MLPFANAGSTADGEYFAEGLTAEIIGRLTAIPALHVSAPTAIEESEQMQVIRVYLNGAQAFVRLLILQRLDAKRWDLLVGEIDTRWTVLLVVGAIGVVIGVVRAGQACFGELRSSPVEREPVGLTVIAIVTQDQAALRVGPSGQSPGRVPKSSRHTSKCR